MNRDSGAGDRKGDASAGADRHPAEANAPDDEPSAELTFLFTDVVGSTRLWEAQPLEMAEVMELHDTILEAAFAHEGAAAVKNTGDGFMVVFRSGGDAVIAAVSFQRRLLATEWPSGLRPSVRAGLHTGRVTARSGDFFGGTVNRAARVAQVAHGGQIIMSAATAEAARGRLGPVDLADLGIHRLRDLANPEHIYQVLAEGLGRQFPPLPTLDQFRHNLPVERAPFIGREPDLLAVERLLEEHRLVTLRGVGGAGKTRLALQAAAERVDEHSDGIWMCRLDTIDSDEEVVHAVAAAVGATAAAGSTAEAALADWGRNRSALTLFDNCEHVVEGVADLAVYLLERCPELKVLATSREVIGIGGEAIYEVGPMPHEVPEDDVMAIADLDAGALFVERARAIVPDFTVTADNAAVIVEICERLDGIPLALELAAARLNVLSPADLASRLEDRFRLLSGGDRTAMPRQRTLQAAVEWSYDLLDEDERRVFDRLSVFRGGFTLEAAEAVVGTGLGNVDVLDTLGRLVDRSMLFVDREPGSAGPRFGILETLREFSSRNLEESGLAADLGSVHGAYFADLATTSGRELRGSAEERWLEQLDAEYANLRRAVTISLSRGPVEAALQIVGGLKLYFIARDELIPEVRSWVEAIIAANPDLTLDLAHALSTGGLLAWSQGDLETADQLHSRSLELAREVGSAVDVFRATGDLGLVAVDQGAHHRARELFAEGLDIARTLDDPGDIAVAVSNLASVEDPHAQAELLAEALAIHQLTGRHTGIAHVNLMTGWLQLSEGELGLAEALFDEARVGFTTLGNRTSAVVALCGLADTALQMGDFELASDHVSAAEELGRSIEWSGISAIVTTRRAAAVGSADPSWRLQELAEAADAWELSGLTAGLAENDGLRALVALDRDDTMAAASWSTQSRDRWLRLGRSSGIAWASSIMALVEQARSGHQRALALHGASLAAYALARDEPYPLDGFLAPGPGSLASRLDALERAGICALEAGSSEDGLVALVAAERERHRTGIVAGHLLARDVEAAREVLRGPVPEASGDFALVFAWAAGRFAGPTSN